MFFAKTLATLTGAGLSLEKTLIAIRNQSNSKPLRRILLTVLVDVVGGESLTVSLQKYPRDFNALFIRLVGVGENSGRLSASLEQIAKHLEKKRLLAAKIQSALLYPIIVTAGTLAAAAYLILFLLPQLLPLFRSLKVGLPLTTRAVIAVSSFLLDWGWLVLLVMALLILTAAIAWRHETVRHRIHSLLLRTPVVGPIAMHAGLTQSANIVGTLQSSGVHIVDALRIAGRSSPNLVYRDDFIALAEELEEGGELARYLARRVERFPAVAVQVISVGEQSGKLDEAWLFLSTYSERELDQATRTLTTVLEPLLLLVIGLFVGLIAVSIITPIYQLTGAIQ
jgi:type II secretory pathway component PulF